MKTKQSSEKQEPAQLMSSQERAQKIIDEIKEKKPPSINGAFGDVEVPPAYIEQVIDPPTGGRFVKIYGCSFLWKGLPINNQLEFMAMGKSLGSVIPTKIIAKSWFLMGALGLMYMFANRRFWHYARIYAQNIYTRVVLKVGLPKERYNVFAKSILKIVGAGALQRAMSGDRIDFHNLHKAQTYEDVIHKNEKYEAIWYLTEMLVLFLELDNAYRFRFQDALECLNKSNVRKNVKAEVRRLFDEVFLVREQDEHMIRKWGEMRRVAMFALTVSPFLRKVTREILLQINQSKVSLDSNDWYFCLQRKCWNFRGKSFVERMEEKQKIDKERGHLFVVSVPQDNEQTRDNNPVA